MAMVGFDPTLVRSSIEGVQSGYNAMVQALKGDMQSKFVDSMAQYWACKEAQDFFAKVKTEVDGLLKSVREVYQSVVDSMNSAAVQWGTTTGYSGWAKMGLGGTVEVISVDKIQENLNGVRGIDEEQAKSTTSTALNTIKTSVQSALTSTKTAVSNSGFVGRDQANTLIKSLNTISTDISKTLDDLNTAMNKAISDTADAYGNLGAKVTTAFGGE